jgi:HAD superfamily hydrolase (TIGR01549 family)
MFDLDGTLVEFNIPLEKIKRELGIEDGYILEHILSSPEHEREKKLEILKKYELASAFESVLMPGAKEFVSHLEENNLKKGVITRNCLDSVNIITRKHLLNFDYIITREVAPPKPNAEPIKLAMKIAKAKREESVMVGDHLVDMLAGRNAGVATVLVINRKNSSRIDEFSKYADYVIRNLTELSDFVKFI